MPLAEADMGLTTMAFAEGADPGDDQLLVKFYLHAREDEAASAKEGRPIFVDTEYVSICVPGQKDNVVIRPARPTDKTRFPQHYAAFKNRGEDGVVGTPLAHWPGLTRGQVEELRFFKVTTVEQLAALSDTNAQNFMGIGKLRTKAKLFLEASAGGAAASKMAAELESRDNEIATLKAAMEEMRGMISELKRDSVPDSSGHGK